MVSVKTNFGAITYSSDLLERYGLNNKKEAQLSLVQVNDGYYQWGLKHPNGHIVYIDPYFQAQYDPSGRLGIKDKRCSCCK